MNQEYNIGDEVQILGRGQPTWGEIVDKDGDSYFVRDKDGEEYEVDVSMIESRKKSYHLPMFEDFKNPRKLLNKEKLHEGIIVVGEEDVPEPEIPELDDAPKSDNASQGTKDYAKEIMTHLRNNNVTVYSNRMYSEKDGTAHIPIKHSDAYDQGVVDELNKKGQKVRKILSKAGFTDFDTKFETDKIIGGSTLFLTINPK